MSNFKNIDEFIRVALRDIPKFQPRFPSAIELHKQPDGTYSTKEVPTYLRPFTKIEIVGSKVRHAHRILGTFEEGLSWHAGWPKDCIVCNPLKNEIVKHE